MLLLLLAFLVVILVLEYNNELDGTGDVWFALLMTTFCVLLISVFTGVFTNMGDKTNAPTYSLRGEHVEQVYNISDTTCIKIDPLTSEAYFLYNTNKEVRVKTLCSDNEVVYYNTEREGRNDAFTVHVKYGQKPYVLLWQLWAWTFSKQVLFLPEYMKP